MFRRWFRFCSHREVIREIRQLRECLMATVQEVTDAFNAKMAGLATQIAAVEEQVEQLFVLVAAGGADSAALDALKAAIESGLDALGASVVKIGEDDPNNPAPP